MADNRDWAKDTVSEVAKEDPLRLIDLENDTQMLLSKIPGAPSETDRAINNYRSMVFDEPKPAVDHLIEGTGRILPTLATAGASLGVSALNKAMKKGSKNLAKKLLTPIKNSIKTKYAEKAFKKHVNEQLKDLEKKYGKTTIQTLNEKYFKNVKKPLDEFDEFALKLSPAGKTNRNALNDITDVYRNSIDNFVREKISKYEGSAEDRYFKLMTQKDDLAKVLNTDSQTIEEAIKRVAGEEDVAEQVQKLNFRYDIDRDVKANPEVYKNVPEKDYSKVWEERKIADENLMSSSNKFFDEDINIAHQPISQEELNKAADELGLSIKGNLKNLGNYSIAKAGKNTFQSLPNTLRPNKEEPEFKNKTFDKEPDTSLPKTLLQSLADVIGFDWRNPNRFNSEDIEYFLMRAQEEGLLSNDNWKNWSARQQVEKVDEIAHSDEGKRLVEMLRDE
jgi:hypothetical protein